MSKTWKEIHKFVKITKGDLTPHQDNCMVLAKMVSRGGRGIAVSLLCDLDDEKVSNLAKITELAEIIDNRFPKETLSRFIDGPQGLQFMLDELLGGLQ